MKRLWLILCLCLLCACASHAPEDGSTAQLYFPNARFSAESPISAQSVHCAERSVQALAELYSTTAPDLSHRAAIPASWQLREAAPDGSTAVIHFDGNVCTSAVARSLAYACLSQTMTQAEGVQQLLVYSPNDPDGLLLTPGDILFADTHSGDQEEDLILYLPDPDSGYLERTIRTVPAMDEADKPAYLVSQLIENGRCLPKGTLLRDIQTDYGVCSVNLSEEFVSAMPRSFTQERLAVYSIVNSLTELDTVYRVELRVEGAPLSHLNFLSFSGELTRDETLFAPEQQPGMLNACVYLVCSYNGKLVPIPCAIQPEPNAHPALALLHALVSTGGRDGIINALPANLRILSLKVEDHTCVVDVTGEFSDGGAVTQLQQLRSLIATLTVLKDIDQVEVYVEGIEPDYSQPELYKIKQCEDDWFAEKFLP